MIAFKYLLLVSAVAVFVTAAAVVIQDVVLARYLRRKRAANGEAVTTEPVRWRTSIAFLLLAWLPLLIGLIVAIVSS
jgi:hypothetical protein